MYSSLNIIIMIGQVDEMGWTCRKILVFKLQREDITWDA